MTSQEFEQVLEAAYEQIVQACPGAGSETISGYSPYQPRIPSGEQPKIRNLARRIVGSFRSGCQPIRIVRLVGHADRDPLRESREPGFLMRISRERALAVQHQLERFIKDPAIFSKIAFDRRGA